MRGALLVRRKSRASVGDYDYLNARVRGMSTHLLRRDFYEQVLSNLTGSVLVDALLSSPIAEEMRQALAEAGRRGTCRIVESAAIRNTHATFAKVLAISPPEPRRLLSIVINRWDVAAVLSLARALCAGSGWPAGGATGSAGGALAAASGPHAGGGPPTPGPAGGALPAAGGPKAGEGAPATRESFLSIGELDDARLAELATAKSIIALADALTAWGHGFSFPLRRALRECDNRRDPREIERALYEGYFSWALAQLRPSDRNERLVRQCVRMQIDLTNVGLALARVRDKARDRARGVTQEAPAGGAREDGGGREASPPVAPIARVRDRARGDGEGEEAPPPIVPLERGTIATPFLHELSAAESLEVAFEQLMETYFAPGVEKGILSFGQARSLGVMERFLEGVLLERACRLFRGDSLGVSVPLGFVWRKYCELANLRLLARGVAYHMPANAIRQELVLG